MSMLFVILFSIHRAFSFVVDEGTFSVGQEFVWSYSEQVEGQWQKPYLYETYKVTEVQKNGDITFEMSSSQTLVEEVEPHHKFKANLFSCLRLGKKKAALDRWKIQFYTKNWEKKGWSLVSKNHSGLAFTEKFNCRSYKEGKLFKELQEQNQILSVVSYEDLDSQPWYLNEELVLKGVAIKRQSSKYLMRLIAK